ncbi:integrase, catalytic region, zinc finger, CCHC-type containing protein [Tanacetum coccineum]|uniref:Integrase, catalytic region, zinc finger, CCHC-type containing protein n=1 Tax=Tanacetum coccineum TaxID=301880 RepID=A0ABQ4YCF5_9ASTR
MGDENPIRTLDVANRERTRLHLFQFSIRDQASNWLERLPAGSIPTWEDLTTRFLAQFQGISRRLSIVPGWKLLALDGLLSWRKMILSLEPDIASSPVYPVAVMFEVCLLATLLPSAINFLLVPTGSLLIVAMTTLLNSKFVNNMLPEWGRFVIAVKLNRGLKTSNYDQLYAYLKQHEADANKSKMMLKKYTQHAIDPLVFVSNVSLQQYPTQSSSILQSTYVPPVTYNQNL